jgi:hypothetical protein
MSDDVLDHGKRRVIGIQADLVRAGSFFLAGGTGLGLRLGHRLSDDLDWFTPKPFDTRVLIARLTTLDEKPTKLEQHGRYTLRAYYDTLETSFITYDQVPARPQAISVGGLTIPVADIELLAAMKAAAIHDRGAKRDFIDAHAISRESGWSVARFVEHGAQQLPLSQKQVAMALTYFHDAEKEPMPRGCKVSWESVKTDLVKGVREWERTRQRGLER